MIKHPIEDLKTKDLNTMKAGENMTLRHLGLSIENKFSFPASQAMSIFSF